MIFDYDLILPYIGTHWRSRALVQHRFWIDHQEWGLPSIRAAMWWQINAGRVEQNYRGKVRLR